ncbi:MAG: endolytic transglycosylase MltG, partial [Actinomycetaceae bacterium]|nr:endolytic transglycosylase MltG [Actinomycetaceae bacterium]
MTDFFDEFTITGDDTSASLKSGDGVDSSRSSAKKPKEKQGKKMKNSLIIGIVSGLVVAIAIGIYPLFTFMGGDYDGEGTGSVQIVIPDGASGSAIASILADNDVVKSEGAFIRVCRADSRCSSIQPGTYNLRTHMSAKSALSALLNRASKAEVKITIPEGFTKTQVFERIANVLNIQEQEVSDAAADAGAIGLPEVAGGELEGWIAPLTYTFEPGVSATDVLKAMVAARIAQMEELNISQDAWQETLIKASIVEREVVTGSDYAKVARVIENRLIDTASVQGRLQMDSTVLYGVGKIGGSPTQAELSQDTPYNTYIHAGLPPSPISNPGVGALEGVCNPAQGDWLYFVTVNLESGETKFSATLAEHEKNIEEYRA